MDSYYNIIFRIPMYQCKGKRKQAGEFEASFKEKTTFYKSLILFDAEEQVRGPK